MNGTAYGFLRRGTGGRQGPQEKPWENIENHTAYVSDVLPLAGAVQRGAHRSPTKPASLMYSPCDVQRLYCCSRIVLPKGACVFRGDNPFPPEPVPMVIPSPKVTSRCLPLPPVARFPIASRCLPLSDFPLPPVASRACPNGNAQPQSYLPLPPVASRW